MSSRKNEGGIRAFIALDPPKSVLDSLETAQQTLSRRVAPASVAWVRRPAVHLTLAFLGDGIPSDKVAQLCDMLDQLAPETPPVQLELGPLGCFPNPRRPRVLWIGLEGDLPGLQLLKNRLDQALEPLGWPAEERPFAPHLTLGRVKDQMGVVNHDLPYGQQLVTAGWTAAEMILYRSQLTRQGAIYTKIHSAALAAGR